MLVFFHLELCSQLFLPLPVRSAIALVRSVKYIREGLLYEFLRKYIDDEEQFH